jgi:hypothetical protein
MQKFILVILAVCASGASFAQLQNTRWKATVKGDNPRNVILDFKKDSVILYTVSDSEIVEKMTYTVDKSQFIVKKTEGQSDCDNSTPGTYGYRMVNGKMLVRLISDACSDRSSALDSTYWTKWKDHPAVKLASGVLQQYVGVYQFDPQHQLFITLEDGKLYIEGPNNNLPKNPLIPESNTRFFVKIAGVEMDFVKDANGKVIKFISHEEQDHDVMKIK